MPRKRRFLPISEIHIRTRGYLPHWEMPGAIYSITFRLHDALPPGALSELMERKQILDRAIACGRITGIEAMQLRRELERRFDAALDRHHGSAFMLDPAIADLVATTLTHFDGVRYRLEAWSVMPNHVHAVVQPFDPWELKAVLHSWKSWSSNRANEMLGREGAFWQKESFDRIVRDDEDLERTVGYVLANPAKAGLGDWPWTSAGWKPADRPAGSRRYEPPSRRER